MKFHIELDQRIFQLISILLVAITLTICVSAISIFYMDYEYYKRKLEHNTVIKPAISANI